MSKGKPVENDGNDLIEESVMTKRRKIEHIEICLQENVQCNRTTLLEDVGFVHKALPEIDKDAIDLTTNFIGLHAGAPLVIAAMTGGHPDTTAINKRLAEAAEEMKIPIGVGSQRAGIENPDLIESFRVVRDAAPNVPIIANIGATHVDVAADAVEMIDADILAIHLNPLQEAIQPEGDCNSMGVVDNIALIVESVDVPVMVKETGAGISSEVAMALEAAGVSAIDIGGVGGTSWAAVEYYRALRENDSIKAQLGLTFWDWGIPTALSLILVTDVTKLDVVATGGIRSGVDIAKTLALGATAAGMAYPFLEPAVNGTTQDVIAEIELHLEGLRTAMYLTGCEKVEDLAAIPLTITGELREHLESLDLDYLKIAKGQ